MGCCEPVLAPIENYYTKYQIDKMIASAVTSGCCITPEEVDEKIEEAISGITVSGVTEEELNNAIASAKTEIEAEIPTVPTKVSAFENDVPYLTEHQSLSGYATEQWVLDKHYISGVDLSDYALKSEIPTVPTSNTAFTNDAGYLTEHQSLDDYYTKNQTDSAISAATSGYVTSIEMSAFTYDKATIDEKVASGGTFDPTQYYNTAQTNSLIESAVTRVEGEIPSLSGYATEQWVLDKNYITGVDLSNYATKDEIPTVPTSNTAFTNDAGYLTEHQSLSGYATEQWVEDKHYITGVDLSDYSTTDEVNSAITQATSGKANSSDVYLKSETSGATEIQNALNAKADPYSAGTGISIIGNVISATGGGGAEPTVSALTCYKDAIPSNINYSEGSITTFYLKYSGSGGWGVTSFSFTVYNNGVDEYKTIYANYNDGVFTAITTSDSAYTATIENGYIKVVLTSGCSFKSYSSSYYCTPFLIEQYSSGTTSDVMVNTVYDTICRLSDKNLNNVIKRVDGHIGDGRLYLYNQGTLGDINSSTEIASSTINTDGGKLNVHFSGDTSHDAVLNAGSGNYCELFSVWEYSKGKDDIEMTINSAYTGDYTMTPFSISFVDTNNNTTYFEFEYNITANTISTPSGYATYGTIVDTLSTDYKVKFLPNSGYKIASFRSNSCLIVGVDNTHPNDYITNLVTTTSYDYNGQEVIDDFNQSMTKY